MAEPVTDPSSQEQCLTIHTCFNCSYLLSKRPFKDSTILCTFTSFLQLPLSLLDWRWAAWAFKLYHKELNGICLELEERDQPSSGLQVAEKSCNLEPNVGQASVLKTGDHMHWWVFSSIIYHGVGETIFLLAGTQQCILILLKPHIKSSSRLVSS